MMVSGYTALASHDSNFEQQINNSIVWPENHQTLIENFCGKIVFDLLFVWQQNRTYDSLRGQAACTIV